MPPSLTRLAPLLLATLAVGLALRFGVAVQDDAFISFRYAEHLVGGHGLVYNLGERVEGYTNLSWTLFIAAGMALGIDPVATVIAGGLLSLGGAVGATWALARRAAPAGTSAAWVLLAPLFLAIDGQQGLEAVEGLETLSFALLVAAGVARALDERGGEGLWRHTGSSLIFGLALLTRPEAPALVGSLHLGLLWASDDRRGQLRASVAAAVPFAAVLVGLTAWRLAYYGQPLPNTFYAKVGGLAVHRGLLYLVEHAARHPVLWGGLALALLPGGRGRALAPLAVPVGLHLAWVVAVGGDFKPTARFIAPVLPLMAVLAGEGLRRGAGLLPRRAGQVAAVAAVAAVLALALRVQLEMESHAAARRGDMEARRIVGEWLAGNTPADAVLAIHSAGVIPYYAQRRTIDMWGLTDPHIARAAAEGFGDGMAGHERTDPAYVFSQDPDLYLPEDHVFALKPWTLEPEPGFPADFTERYRAVSLKVEGRWLNCWVKRDR